MRPMIVGLNNPYSRRESDALLHYPKNATGWRILEMIRLADPSFTADDYLDAFDRRNLWPGIELPEGPGSTGMLRAHGRQLMADLAAKPRDVVLLGLKVWYAVLGRRSIPPKFSAIEKAGSTFYYVPHPSGLCRDYNDAENRRRGGEVLLKLARPRVARMRRFSR